MPTTQTRSEAKPIHQELTEQEMRHVAEALRRGHHPEQVGARQLILATAEVQRWKTLAALFTLLMQQRIELRMEQEGLTVHFPHHPQA